MHTGIVFQRNTTGIYVCNHTKCYEAGFSKGLSRPATGRITETVQDVTLTL
jgi:hypothetical protein